MASSANESEQASVKTVKCVPVDTDNNRLIIKSNPAALEGVLHELSMYFQREGYFQELIEDYAVLLPNGKLAVSDIDSVYFVTGRIVDPTPRSLNQPCPDTPRRLLQYNAARTAAGESTHTSTTTLPAGTADTVIVQKRVVQAEDAKYASVVISMMEDRDHATELMGQCGRSGRRLVELLKAWATASVKPKDFALTQAEFNRKAAASMVGAPTLASFNTWYRNLTAARREVKLSSRASDADMCEHVNALFFKDPALRENYDLRLAVAAHGNLCLI